MSKQRLDELEEEFDKALAEMREEERLGFRIAPSRRINLVEVGLRIEAMKRGQTVSQVVTSATGMARGAIAESQADAGTLQAAPTPPRGSGGSPGEGKGPCVGGRR